MATSKKTSSSRTSLAFPPALSDYPAGSWVMTVLFLSAMVWGWVLSWLAQVLFSCSVGWFMRSKTRLQSWQGYWFRLFSAKMTMTVVPGLSIRKTSSSWQAPKEVLMGEKAVLVVANHRSFLDPFALGASLFPLECKYVAKADLFKVPFGGWAMCRAGDLAVKFDKNRNQGWGTVKGSTGELLRLAAEQLSSGNSVAIYPEGTRMGYSPEKSLEAKGCGVMNFKPAFFDLAKKLDVPIVCVAMKGTDDAWPVGSNMLRPASILVDVSEPMLPADYDSDVALADAARNNLGAMYTKLCQNNTKAD